MPEAILSCANLSGDSRVVRSTAQPSVICVYHTVIGGSITMVSVTWCRSILGQGFSVSFDGPIVDDICKIDVWSWFCWKRRGSKNISVYGMKVEVSWDLTSAKYARGPEPMQGFYVVVACKEEIVLLLGDMHKEVLRRLNLRLPEMASMLLMRKEHLFGKKTYITKARFVEMGPIHDIIIECHIGDVKEPWLCVRVDKQTVVLVQHLMWKFRGNQTILVDGAQIEVLWDVYGWLFDPSYGCAIFMFQTSGMNEKPWLPEISFVPSSILQWPATHSFRDLRLKQCYADDSCASVLQWPNSLSFRDVCDCSAGISLVLYTWRND